MIRSLLIAIALFALRRVRRSPHLSRVRVEQGEAQGVVRDGVRVFRSLPYAAPPVGALRLRAPQPAPAWEGVREATRARPALHAEHTPARNGGRGPAHSRRTAR